MTIGFPVDGVILVAASLLILGVVVVGYSDRLRLPASLLSLGLGMVVGSDVLGWVDLDDAALVRDLGIVALIIILFEGGLTTKPTALREAGIPGFILSNVGLVLTALFTAVGVQLLLAPGWEIAWLLGAVVASTDAAVVFDLLRKAPLPRRLGSILEVESGANDPVAIILTVALVDVVSGGSTGPAWAGLAIWQLVGGLLVGGTLGLLGSLLLSLRFRSQGLYPLLAAGIGGLSYAVAASVAASGFLAVYITGLVIGAKVVRQRRVIRTFHASLASGTDIALFMLLGLLVFPSRLPAVAGIGLTITAVLLLVARPLAVFISLFPFRLTRGEKVLLSWAGLRGAVPIVLATIPATAGVPGGQTIFDVVFFVVVTSTLLQGTTVVPLARRLGLTVDRPAWRSIAETVPLEGVDVDLVELTISADLPVVGQRLAEVPLGPGMLVTAVIRDGHTLLPEADTTLGAGDVVVVAVDTSQRSLDEVATWAHGGSGGRSNG